MEVSIIHFEPTLLDGPHLATIDIRLDYPGGKWEIFRNLRVIRTKKGGKFISFPNCKRGEKWIPIYERSLPVPVNTLKEVSDMIEERLGKQEPRNSQHDGRY